MPTYLVKSSFPNPGPIFDGHDAAVVTAKDLATAQKLVQASVPNGNSASWQASATYTDITAVADLRGWTFAVAVNTSTATAVTYTGITADTYATAAAALVLLLNAAGTGITHAAYATNVLTLVGAADNLGNKIATLTVTPPASLFPSTYTWAEADMVGTVTVAGTSTQALTATFVSSFVNPQVFEKHAQVGFTPLVEHPAA